MARRPNQDFFQEYREAYRLLAELYEATGRYVQALKYEKLRNQYNEKVLDAERYDEIKGMQKKYELNQKEQEIEHLQQTNQYQRNKQYLYLGLALMIAIGAILAVRAQRLKRKHVSDQLQITELKKEEAELQAQLHEEQLRRMETEKYEALVDVHFKELELSGKEKELQSLAQEKEQLLQQLSDNSQALEQYQLSRQRTEAKLNANSLKNLFKETEHLIISKLNRTRHFKEYLNRLGNLSESVLVQLDNQTNGSLSAAYLKYCICFIIDMEIKDMSICFSIEPSSIHMIRYRLKQRFGLTKDKDLDHYFANLRAENSTTNPTIL